MICDLYSLLLAGAQLRALPRALYRGDRAVAEERPRPGGSDRQVPLDGAEQYKVRVTVAGYGSLIEN